MDLKETYDQLQNNGNSPYSDMGKALINSITLYGLGVQPKSDLEALLFHCICNAIEGDYSDRIQELDYALMQLLRISPTKLRSLRVIRSAKFLNDLDWHSWSNKERIVNALRNAPIGDGNIREGKIKIVVSDPHTQNLIERMIEDNQGILDKSFSPRILVLNAEQFLGIVAAIFGDGTQDGYDRTIKAIKEEAHEINDELTKENIFDKFQDAFKEHAFSKLIELGRVVAQKAIFHKLGID